MKPALTPEGEYAVPAADPSLTNAIPAPPETGAPARSLSTISPRIYEVAATALLVLLAVASKLLLNSDGDTAQHLAMGHLILNGGIPHTDIISHAHFGQPFLDWEWLADVLFAATENLLGLNGVAILAAALIAGTLYLLGRWAMARGLHPVPALLLGMLAAVTSEIHWLARPHLFSFLLMLVVLYLLEAYRTARIGVRWLATVPPLIALWANLHASVVLGLIACGTYLGGAILEGMLAYRRRASDSRAQQTARRHAQAFGLTLLASSLLALLNPYGGELYTHILSFTQSSFITHLIIEWQPPNFATPITWAFLLLLAAAAAIVAATWRRIPPAHAVLLAGITYESLQAARNILYFSILVPALLAPQLAYLINRRTRAEAAGRAPVWARYRPPTAIRQGVPWLFGGTLACLIAIAALGGQIGSLAVLRGRWAEPPFPIAAVHYLQTTAQPPQGKMFNYITWGGYLVSTLHPRYLIFISTQQDAYGDQLTRDYLDLERAAPGWETLLDRYDVGWVLETPTSRLVGALRTQPARWQVTYEDPTAVILTRR